MLFKIFQEIVKMLSKFDLVLLVASNEFNKEPIALFHEIYMLLGLCIFFLCTVTDKVHCKLIHIERAHEALVFFVLQMWKLEVHDILFLLIC